MNEERQMSSEQPENSEEKKLTKRERRELRKQERQLERLNQEKKFKRNKSLKTAGAILIVALVIFGLYKFTGRTDTANAQEWTKGPADAAVNLVEYSDFQCPACKSYSEVLAEIYSQYSDNLSITYRHYPLITLHANARLAAQAAEAAGAQGKFWEMHDRLFADQSLWGGKGDAHEDFAQYAQDLELDVDKFKSEIDSRSIKAKVNANIQSGNRDRINSTPTFFLNGKKIGPFNTFDEFRNIVKSAIMESDSVVESMEKINEVENIEIGSTTESDATGAEAETFDLLNF